jgi:hypothetical protein
MSLLLRRQKTLTSGPTERPTSFWGMAIAMGANGGVKTANARSANV